MKKGWVLALVICLFCTSCLSAGGTAKDDRKMPVAAIGFDSAGDNIRVSVEMIMINTENFESELLPLVFTGEGRTIKEALSVISQGLTRSMLLHHCGVIAVGEGVSADWFDQICDYCFSEDHITLSAYMIATKDCKDLLDGDPESSVAVGYDIMGIIEQETSQSGVAYNSRYFEVEALRERGENSFALPYFKREEDGVRVEGMQLFHQNKQIREIDAEKAGMYAVITGGISSGTVMWGSHEYQLASRRVTCSKKGGGEVTLRLVLSEKSANRETCRKLQTQLERFRREIERETQTDVFGFEDLLREHFKDYDPKKTGGYENIRFTVQCRTMTGEDADE
ncbi:MAG: hypothetical protein IJT66_02575 [Clostridia bacterium]|nr:hypothetical protein [Clostridia bacterium]